jgi:peptide deformylase
LDHLDGILFPDRMEEDDRERIDKPLRALKKATRKRLARET